MTPAARATRIVRSVPDIGRSGVQDVGQEAAQLRGARHELEAPLAELDDRDRGEVGAFPGGIGVDVAFDEPGDRRPACARSSSRAISRPRASSHRPQSGRPYRMRSGRGASVISRWIVGEGRRSAGFRVRARYDDLRAPVAQWTERGRPKACVGGSSPSGGATFAITIEDGESAADAQGTDRQRSELWRRESAS